MLFNFSNIGAVYLFLTKLYFSYMVRNNIFYKYNIFFQQLLIQNLKEISNKWVIINGGDSVTVTKTENTRRLWWRN